MLSEVQDGLVTCHSLLPLAEIPKNNIYVKKKWLKLPKQFITTFSEWTGV